jgi:hypothetical protein
MAKHTQRYVSVHSITFRKFIYDTFPRLSFKCHYSFLEKLKQITEKISVRSLIDTGQNLNQMRFKYKNNGHSWSTYLTI